MPPQRFARLGAAPIVVLLALASSGAQSSPLSRFPPQALLQQQNVLETTGIPIGLPYGIVSDKLGNLYISDTKNHVVRMLDPWGILSTVAGSGLQGFSGDGGAANTAQLDSPTGLAVDASGNLFFADTHNHRIRKVSSGVITTIAGTGTPGYSGDGGSATQASLSLPKALAADTRGNLYCADTDNHRVRKISLSTGIITTFAGSGQQGYGGDGGPAIAADLDSPDGLAVDTTGNLYISDSLNHRIRKVNLQGVITTLAGNGSAAFAGDGSAATAGSLARPMGLSVDAQGNLYFADSNNQRIRKISQSTLSTIAGTGDQGFSGDAGPALQAILNVPLSTHVSEYGLFLADTHNHIVRLIGPNGDINTAAGTALPADSLAIQLSGAPTATYGTGNITATIVNGSAPSGTVTLKEWGSVITAAPISGSNALLSTSTVGAGKHSLTATYGGDSQNSAVTSGIFLLTVNKAGSTLTLQSAAESVMLANRILLTANAASATAGTPTGSVSFTDDGTTIGSVLLDDAGTAVLPVSYLPLGAHNIKASYGGDNNFAGSVSPGIRQTVQDFWFSASDIYKTIPWGHSATYTIQVEPSYGTTFPGAIALELTGIPPGASYTLTPSSIPASSGPTTVTIAVNTARKNASNSTSHGASATLAVLLTMALPLFVFRKRPPIAYRRRVLPIVLLGLALPALLGIVGCGGLPRNRGQSHIMTLTGTSGALKHSISLTLTVQ